MPWTLLSIENKKKHTTTPCARARHLLTVGIKQDTSMSEDIPSAIKVYKGGPSE